MIRLLAWLGIAFAYSNAGASYVNLDACLFAIPDSYRVTSGSIRGPEVALVPKKMDFEEGRVRIKVATDPPTEATKGEFSARILESVSREKYEYYRLQHTFPGRDEVVESVVLIVGDYSVQITGRLADRWYDYLLDCD